MTKRVCLEPNCPAFTTANRSRCDRHERERDRARGTRQERGYDAAHDAERRQWAPLVATGNVKCWRCAEYISSTEPWDLGHDDDDRSRHCGPEHVACNRGAKARKSG